MTQINRSFIGEKCFCGKDAKHKIAEVVFDDDPNPARHELTTYICDEHFQMIMGCLTIKSCDYCKFVDECRFRHSYLYCKYYIKKD